MLIYFLFLLLPFCANAKQAPTLYSLTEANEEIYTPWFTGPLLAPTPVNIPPGHFAIEPSITVFNTYGVYTSNWEFQKTPNVWALNPLIDFQFGITENAGLEIIASTISNFQKGQRATHFQDTIVYFGYQISNDIKNSWVPDFRLLLQETFPSGKYQHLDPDKNKIDSTGQGSYQTGLVFAFRKLFYLPQNFFSLEWSAGYLFPTTVHVSGYSTYGGSSNTKGKVKPGQTLIAFLSGEYSINQSWVFAFDTEFLYQRPSTFSGKHGTTSSGQTAEVGLPSSLQISFAPEFEYNFNANSGLLAGLWFTMIGKNSPVFASVFISYLYVY